MYHELTFHQFNAFSFRFEQKMFRNRCFVDRNFRSLEFGHRELYIYVCVIHLVKKSSKFKKIQKMSNSIEETDRKRQDGDASLSNSEIEVTSASGLDRQGIEMFADASPSVFFLLHVRSSVARERERYTDRK